MKYLLLTLFIIWGTIGAYSQTPGGITQKGNHNIQVNNPEGGVIIYNTSTVNKEVLEMFLKALKPELVAIKKSLKELRNSLDSVSKGNKEINAIVSSIKDIEEKKMPDSVTTDSVKENQTKLYSVEELSKDSGLIIPVSVANGYAVLRFRNKYGMINASGRMILDYKYDFIDYNGDTNFIAVSRNNEGYYINYKEQKVLVVDGATKVFSFQDSLARTIIKDKYGVIRKDGSFHIKPQYDFIDSFDNGLARVWNKTRKGCYLSGLINQKGELIVPMGFSEFWIDSNYYVFYKQSKDGCSTSSRKGWIALNKKGVMLYKAVKHEHMPSLSSNAQGNIALNVSVKKIKNSRAFLFDSTGRIVREYSGANSQLSFVNDTILTLYILKEYSDQLKRWVTGCMLIGLDGTVILSDNYAAIDDVKGSFFMAKRYVDGHFVYGIVNLNGLEILPFRFSSIKQLEDGQYKAYLFNEESSSKKKKTNKSGESPKKQHLLYNSNFQCIQNCELLN